MKIVAKLPCLRCSMTGQVPSLTLNIDGEIIETGEMIACPVCKGRAWKKPRQVPIDTYDDSY